MKVHDRFTGRVDSYMKYRPHYPDALYEFLLENSIVRPGDIVADIGCGTGISSELFIKNDHRVIGVEPNKNMLEAAIAYLNSSLFTPIQANGEASGLENASVDLVICAQTFHWLDKKKARAEFKRILKPGKIAVLIWNDRKTTGNDFLKVYEEFLQMFGTDYKEVNHKNTQQKEIFDEFFGGEYQEKNFDNFQMLGLEGLKGRVESSSYMPDKNHPEYEYMMYCLKKIFQRYEESEKVKLEYDTRIYYGTIK